KDASTFIADAGDPAKAIGRIAAIARRRTGNYEELSAAVARGAHGRTIAEALANAEEIQRQVGRWQTQGMPPRNQGALHRLPRTQRLALEIALHEDSEQRALEGELESLRRDWQEAEEIAAIADGELTPMPDSTTDGTKRQK